jgi:ABC-type transporter MlaC component
MAVTLNPSGVFNMKNQTIYKMIGTLAICSISFLSVSAIAGPDEFQRQMNQQVMKAKQKLKAAEAAKGDERKKLMGEHMKMMHDNMGKMQAMKPKSGMTMKEHEEWISEHQKLMDEMMGQMMDEHHMMMDMGGMAKGSGEMDCMSKGSGDAHKH